MTTIFIYVAYPIYYLEVLKASQSINVVVFVHELAFSSRANVWSRLPNGQVLKVSHRGIRIECKKRIGANN